MSPLRLCVQFGGSSSRFGLVVAGVAGSFCFGRAFGFVAARAREGVSGQARWSFGVEVVRGWAVWLGLASHLRFNTSLFVFPPQKKGDLLSF